MLTRHILAFIYFSRAVAISKERLTPEKIMTPEAFENALRVLLAVGGSTNAIIHLIAMAGIMARQLQPAQRLAISWALLEEVETINARWN